MHIKTAATILHRNDCFYTAKAHFLIIPALCIEISRIISIKTLSLIQTEKAFSGT